MKNFKKYWLAFIIVFFLSMFIKPAISMLMLGVSALYFGILSIQFLRRMQSNGKECAGKIIEYQSDDEGYKTPIIEFSTATGEFIKEKPSFYGSSDLSKIKSYKNMIDQSVLVLYDPKDPHKFILKEENEFNYFFIILLLLVSIVFIVVSVSCFLGYIKLG